MAKIYRNNDMKLGKYDLEQYILPLMNANMFILISEESALVIDPNVNPDAFCMLSDRGISDITIVLTHEHFDHISGVNAIRDIMKAGACRVIASADCADMITDSDKNLSRFFEAMFITKSEEERMKAMDLFDSDYTCNADIVFESSYEYKWQDSVIRMKRTPGHSPGSICIEIYDDKETLLAVATGDSLVEGNKVITRLPGGDKIAYKEVTRPYLESISGDICILPGHGAISYMKDLELG